MDTQAAFPLPDAVEPADAATRASLLARAEAHAPTRALRAALAEQGFTADKEAVAYVARRQGAVLRRVVVTEYATPPAAARPTDATLPGLKATVGFGVEADGSVWANGVVTDRDGAPAYFLQVADTGEVERVTPPGPAEVGGRLRSGE